MTEIYCHTLKQTFPISCPISAISCEKSDTSRHFACGKGGGGRGGQVRSKAGVSVLSIYIMSMTCTIISLFNRFPKDAIQTLAMHHPRFATNSQKRNILHP